MGPAGASRLFCTAALTGLTGPVVDQDRQGQVSSRYSKQAFKSDAT